MISCFVPYSPAKNRCRFSHRTWSLRLRKQPYCKNSCNHHRQQHPLQPYEYHILKTYRNIRCHQAGYKAGQKDNGSHRYYSHHITGSKTPLYHGDQKRRDKKTPAQRKAIRTCLGDGILQFSRLRPGLPFRGKGLFLTSQVGE